MSKRPPPPNFAPVFKNSPAGFFRSCLWGCGSTFLRAYKSGPKRFHFFHSFLLSNMGCVFIGS